MSQDIPALSHPLRPRAGRAGLCQNLTAHAQTGFYSLDIKKGWHLSPLPTQVEFMGDAAERDGWEPQSGEGSRRDVAASPTPQFRSPQAHESEVTFIPFLE